MLHKLFALLIAIPFIRRWFFFAPAPPEVDLCDEMNGGIMDNFSLNDIVNKQPAPSWWQRFRAWVQRLADGFIR